MDLLSKLKSNKLTAVLVVVVMVLTFLLFQQPGSERIEKKETKIKTTTQQKITEDKKSTEDVTYGRFDTGKKARTYNSAADRYTRKTTKKKITHYDPTSRQPTVVIEEETVTDDSYNRQTTSKTDTVTSSRSDTNSKTTTTTTAAKDVTKTTDETTKAEIVERKGNAGSNSPLGVGVTTDKRVAITYDVVKRGKYSLAGMVEADTKRAEISGLGVGINADITSNGRYYAGVYGKYDLRTHDTKIIGYAGTRF